MTILHHLQTEFSQRQKSHQLSSQALQKRMMHRNSVINHPENASPDKGKSYTHNSLPSYPLLHELVALNPDGTLAPLSLLQRIYYGSAFNKLVHKLERVHLESDQLESLLGTHSPTHSLAHSLTHSFTYSSS